VVATITVQYKQPVKRFRFDLCRDRAQEEHEKNQRAHRVAKVHRHRERVAGRLTQGGSRDFDDPKGQRHLRNLARDSPIAARSARRASYETAESFPLNAKEPTVREAVFIFAIAER